MPRYIDAEKMQSLLEEEIEGCGNPTADDNPIAYGTTLGLKMALSYAKTLPTADTAPVCHAQWKHIVYHNGCTYDEDMICSVCGKSGVPYWEYCPNCGAKMDEELKV